MMRRRPIAALAALFFALTFGVLTPAQAQQIIGGANAAGVGTPAIAPTSPYGTGQSLCVPNYGGVTYQWARDGADIGGETARCHTTVSGDGGHTLTTKITVAGVPVTAQLQISGSPVTTGQLNQAYGGFSASASGGFAPITFSLNAGTFPTGITLNSSTGAVSGTPTQTGTFSGLVIRASDAQSHTADLASFNITISNYTASAVVIHPWVKYGTSAALGANGGTDTTHFVYSWWERSTVLTKTAPGVQDFYSAELLDLFGGNKTVSNCSSEECPGALTVYDNASTGNPPGTVRLNIADSSSDAGLAAGHSFEAQLNDFARQYNTEWHHHLWVADMGFGTGLKRNAYYLDGVKQTLNINSEFGGSVTAGICNGSNVGQQFCPNINSTRGWSLAPHTGTGTNGSYSIADFYLNTVDTTAPGCSGFGDASNHLIDSSGNVCPSLISAFISGGKPVDIGGSTNCSLPTGNQPQVCFSGDMGNGTTTGFAANKGSATGTFAFTNPITNGANTSRFWNDSYGPSGPPTNRPYMKWNAGAQSNSLTNSATGMTGSGVISNYGNPIALNDFMLMGIGVTYTSANVDNNIVCPSGWTGLTASTHLSGSYLGTYRWCYKFATAGDVTAKGADMATPPAPSWTADNTNTPRSSYWFWAVYGNVNVSTGLQTSGMNSYATRQTGMVAPTLTPTSAPALLVTSTLHWDSSINNGPDASEELRASKYVTTSASNGGYLLADKVLNSTSATGTTSTTFAGPNGSSGVALNLILSGP